MVLIKVSYREAGLSKGLMIVAESWERALELFRQRHPYVLIIFMSLETDIVINQWHS